MNKQMGDAPHRRAWSGVAMRFFLSVATRDGNPASSGAREAIQDREDPVPLAGLR
jgi:hypothetical protein